MKFENRKIKRLLTKYHFRPPNYPRSATFSPQITLVRPHSAPKLATFGHLFSMRIENQPPPLEDVNAESLRKRLNRWRTSQLTGGRKFRIASPMRQATPIKKLRK